MAFRRGDNQHDTWLRFCDEHRELLAETGLPNTVTRAEHRFRDLLRDGTVETEAASVSLEELVAEKWSSLEKFTRIFFREFESYAPLDLFPAFRHELPDRSNASRS